MTVATRVEVLGAKDTIRSLRKIDPQVRRQFTRDAKQIIAPIVDEAVRQYPPELLSGMARNWSVKGRQLFPYDQRNAIRGLKVKIDTGRRAGSVIKLVQTNPAAAIYETAGKKTGNRLGDNLTRKFVRASRLLWPIADRKLPEVQAAMHDLVMVATRRVQKEVR